MKWFSFSLKVVALAVVAALIGSLSVKETAAYERPTGSATLTGSSTSVSVGGTAELTLTVVNSAGNPVAGKSCELYISSQPGTDASIIQDSAKTDANGVITGSLYVGTARGTVQVTANCGNLFAGLSVVAGAAVAPPQAPVEPAQPAQPGRIAMPPTGVGPAADGETYGLGLIIALLAGGSLTLAAGSVLFLKARRVVRS
jgi:hypothetical protein